MGRQGHAVYLRETREMGIEHGFESLKVTDQFSDLDIDGSIILKTPLNKDVNIWTYSRDSGYGHSDMIC
jgi:hypothetical protein